MRRLHLNAFPRAVSEVERKKPFRKVRKGCFFWRPLPDLNRCRRRERAVSWAGLDEGDLDGEPRWDRTNDHLIKSQVLYRLS